MTEFDKGWWNCFISFANELCFWERDCDKVIQNVMCGAGVEVHEIDCGKNLYILVIWVK